MIGSADPLCTATSYFSARLTRAASLLSETQLFPELTTIIMERETKIEVPSISPFGYPSLINPIMIDTIAAKSRI